MTVASNSISQRNNRSSLVAEAAISFLFISAIIKIFGESDNQG